MKLTEGSEPAGPAGNDAPDDRSASLSFGTGRLLRVDSESPFAQALDCFTASDRAQLASLAAIARIFLDEVIAALNLINPNPGEPYRHATLHESSARANASRTKTGAVQSETEGPVPLPQFPGFRPTHTLFSWVHDHARADDISELAALTGTTTARAFSLVRTAMALTHGLPQFHERCRNGDFTIEHGLAATKACQELSFVHLSTVDDYLARRRADATVETFRKSLHLKVASLQPISETIEKTSTRRRVDITTCEDGTAFLTLTGPAPELHACYRRIEAFARAIHSGNTSAFGTQLTPGDDLDDPRGVSALMFDILSRTQPQVSVRATRADRNTGAVTSTELPIGGLFGHCEGLFAADLSSGTGASGDPGASGGSVPSFAFPTASATAGGNTYYEVLLRMPTHAQWLSTQAKVTATVPFLTLANRSDLPGMLADGSPVPADMARDLASHSSTWTRILTDPATGTPVDAKATTYQIPGDVRRTLVAQWARCTIPGCVKRAETSEIDHIVPFDHSRPEGGGLTRFGNLHPLCKQHHQAKTDRRFTVRNIGPTSLEYVFRHGVTAEVIAPDNPIDSAHATLFETMVKSPPSDPLPPPLPVPPSVQPSPAALPPAVLSSGSINAGSGGRTRTDAIFYECVRVPRQVIVGKFHYRGERTTSAFRPGPAPEGGRPGWSECTDSIAFPDLPAGRTSTGRIDATGSTTPGGMSTSATSSTSAEPTDSPDTSGSARSNGPAGQAPSTASGDTDESSNDPAQDDSLREWFWDSGEPPPF